MWVGSSMVEQRPFKSLVSGSSPDRPTISAPVAQRIEPQISNLFIRVRFSAGAPLS